MNFRTHGHGHGYLDLNGLIPEIVGREDFRKGPYRADGGDFALAGAAYMTTIKGYDRSCDSPEQVKQLHDTAVAAGGTSIEAPPGPRETASMGTIELAYFRDPDGNKLCGIHFPA